MEYYIKENMFISKERCEVPPQHMIELGYNIVSANKNDCVYQDFNDDFTFNIDKYNARKQLEENQKRIAELKQQLVKYKEDVEQVELFGMVRDDYEEKKIKCAEIIIELRQLEREVKDANTK